MQQQFETKMAALKLRLYSTDDQGQKPRELLEMQYGVIGDTTAKLFHGKTSKEDFDQLPLHDSRDRSPRRCVGAPTRTAAFSRAFFASVGTLVSRQITLPRLRPGN